MKPRNPIRDAAKRRQDRIVEPTPERRALLAGHLAENVRLGNGLMRESEFLPLARDILFRHFARFPKQDRLSNQDVPHAPLCKQGMGYVEYVIHVLDQPPRGMALVWSAFRTAALETSTTRHLNRTDIPSTPSVEITLRSHTAKCRCGATAMRMAVRVVIVYGGYTLTREYLFQQPKEPSP